MRYFTPDTPNLSGGDSSLRSADAVPSGMDNDPRADEEIIDQRADASTPPDQHPRPADAPKIVPDDLADSIAYALDGSGPGPTNDVPNVSGHKVITEGITGAGLEDEEECPALIVKQRASLPYPSEVVE